jgi:ABC-2 type transport system permease protein
MTSLSDARPVLGARSGQPNLLRIYRTEAAHEFLKLVRVPMFAISTLVFPLMFYVIFGLTFADEAAGDVGVTTYMMATYGAFGVIGCALFGFGVGVAMERGQGWMRLKRVSPMPPQAYFIAKIAMSTSFAACIVVALFVLGATFGGVRMPASQWIGLAAVLVIGAMPFCAMGLAFGYLVGPNSASAVLNLVYLPMAFASGLWIPLSQLPEAVQAIAPFMPPYHLAQLALGILGAADRGSPLLHLAALAAFTVGFLAIAGWGYRRDEGRSYG